MRVAAGPPAAGDPAGPSDDDAARVGRAFSCTAAALALVMVVSVAVHLAARYIGGGRLSGVADTYGLVWPQGWAFFTSPPAGQVTVAYRLGPDGSARLATAPLSDPANLWGIRRSGYAEVLETLLVSRSLPKSSWHDCAGKSLVDCLVALPPAPPRRLANPVRPGRLCGPVAFVTQRPVRWAAARHGRLGASEVLAVSVVDLTC